MAVSIQRKQEEIYWRSDLQTEFRFLQVIFPKTIPIIRIYPDPSLDYPIFVDVQSSTLLKFKETSEVNCLLEYCFRTHSNYPPIQVNIYKCIRMHLHQKYQFETQMNTKHPIHFDDDEVITKTNVRLESINRYLAEGILV